MKAKLLAAAVAVAFVTGATSASAALVDVVYSGTVYDSNDLTGVFGPPNTSLDGDPITVTYEFDTTQGITSASPTQNYAYGGGFYGASSPALSVVITVDGVSVSAGAPNYIGEIYGYNDGSISEQLHEASNYSDNGVIFEDSGAETYIYNYNGMLPASITTPFTYAVQPGDSTSGYFQIQTYTYATGAAQYASGSINIATLTVSVVPEPSTWAMMLIGFAGLGFAGYRTSRRTPAIPV